MATLGDALLILAFVVALYGAGAALVGARRGRQDLVVSARRSVYAMAAVVVGAFALLEAAFIRTDLSMRVVVDHSSETTPLFYRITSVWSSQEGSLLLWLLLLGLWSSLVLFLARRRLRDVQPYAIAVLLGMGAFFAGLLVFTASPFATLATPAAEGAGLNPLLRHPMMAIHPPMLYSGYTLFAIPFAFAVGALIVRRVDAEWIQVTRRFALGAWFFLGVGIMLGARWSYVELGWGGYWAWDPVENASLMPWLTGTAFIHSLMIQERRGMLKIWNATLALATGILAILGTFLVRSGILDSIHAFGASTLGVPFLVLIGLMLAGSIYLVVSRADALRSEHRLDSLWSREAIFLANNVVLVGLCFVVFWGTFFPLIAEAMTGTKQALGPPWFDRYIVPLALVLVLLSGLGPSVAWRRGTIANARRSFTVPTVGALAGIGLAVALGGGGRPLALAMFGCGAFVLTAVGQELWRGTRARRAMSDDGPLRAVVSLVARNRRRYGGYVVHVGIAVLFVGVAASSAFQNARDEKLKPGQTVTIDGYDIRYDRPSSRIDVNESGIERIVFGAYLTVTRDGKPVAKLHPERGYYPSRDERGLGAIGRFFEGEATSEVSMDAGWRRDVWTAVSPDHRILGPIIDEGNSAFAKAQEELTPAQRGELLGVALNGLVRRYAELDPPATFRLIVSPMVAWLWIGGLLVFTGGIIGLWPAGRTAARPATARLKARVAQDLGRA